MKRSLSRPFLVPWLTLDAATQGYLFRDGDRLVCVVWTDRNDAAKEIALGSDKVALWDLMGRTQTARRFAPSGTPVYLTAAGMTDDDFRAAVKDGVAWRGRCSTAVYSGRRAAGNCSHAASGAQTCSFRSASAGDSPLLQIPIGSS